MNGRISRKKARLISVAMIAKDEAGNLVRAVESARRFADEIILVDTGSTDNTVKLAKSLGVKVHHFKWVHDYSAARNESFARCKGEWIFWQDPDEEVPEEDAQKVRAYAESCIGKPGPDEFYFATYINGTYRPPEIDLPGYGPGSVVLKPRMVRRGRFQWRKPIHEDLYKIGDCVRHTDADVRVFNHGDASDANTEYYHALMVLANRDYPDDPHYILYLAEHVLMKNLDSRRALELLSKIDVERLASGEQTEKYWLFVGQAHKIVAIMAHEQGLTEERDKAVGQSVHAYNECKSMRGPLQAATLFLFVGLREHFEDIVAEVRKQHPEDMMSEYFSRLSDKEPDDEKLNEAVGNFLHQLKGATDMEEAYQAVLPGLSQEAAMWSEDTVDCKIVVVVGFRCPEDQPERRRNLQACIEAIAAQDIGKDLWTLILVEQDSERRFPWEDGSVLTSMFDRSYEPFNRGRAFNYGVSHAGVSGKDLVCLMDADMLVDPSWLRRCLSAMSGRAMLPYDRAIYMDEPNTQQAIEGGSFGGVSGDVWHSQGGCIWITAELYEEMGGHDERYVGWGSADRDFYVRLEAALGHKPQRMSQPLYHMWHPPPDEAQKKANAELFEKAHPDTTEEEAAKG